MLSHKQGSVYRVILAFFIVGAFLFALSWPQYTKRRNAVHAKTAADLARALAFAEETYRQQNGAFTSDFRKLELTLTCPLAFSEKGPLLDCAEYTFQLEADNVIRAQAKRLPVWIDVTIPDGFVQCNFPPEDWAGADLCNRFARI